MATKESKVQDYYGNIYVPGMIPVKRTMIIMVLAPDPRTVDATIQTTMNIWVFSWGKKPMMVDDIHILYTGNIWWSHCSVTFSKELCNSATPMFFLIS